MDAGAEVGAVVEVFKVEDTLLLAEVLTPLPPDPEVPAVALPTQAFQFSIPLAQVSVMDSPFIWATVFPFLEILIVTAPRPLKGTLP